MKAIAFLLLGLLCLWLWRGGSMVDAEQNNFAGYPQQVQFGTEHAEVWQIQSGYYAVRGQSEADQPGDQSRDQSRNQSEAVVTFEDGAIAIYAGTPPLSRDLDRAISPVYALQPNGALAVPTGLVFVRFAEGVTAESHQAELQQAGYAITEQPPYAPHTAWVRAQSGQIPDALSGLARLEAISEVENVEPQMLTQRFNR